MKKLITKFTTVITTFLLLSALSVSAQETQIYFTGFEAAEGFTAGTVYNNAVIKYDGPVGLQWGTYYGTASTTSPISGAMSMQMRWYTGASAGFLGYTFTDFDLQNVTKVTFYAANTNGIKVVARYSVDGGVNYVGGQEFALSATSTMYEYIISETAEFPNVRIRFDVVLPDPIPGTTSRLYIDDVTVYGIPSDNQPPVISNVNHSPSDIILSSSNVSISAEVEDIDGSVDVVKVLWGYEIGELLNEESMTLQGKSGLYVANIAAQPDRTLVYYRVYAQDDEGDYSMSSVYHYQVRDPFIASIPYMETFDTDLSDCYTYSVSGDTKYWMHGSFSGNGYAVMNGFGSDMLEHDWLILPGINMSLYANNVVVDFETSYNFGVDNEVNFLKLHYSTDYTGLGDPSLATWHEIEFLKPLTGSYTWEPASVIIPDFDGVVWVGFEYKYSSDYRRWQVDNISIYEAAPSPFNVYFNNPYNWQNVYVYSWKQDKGLGDWPGVLMNAPEPGSPWFNYEIPAENNYIIFNNGSGGYGNQTSDLYRTETGYYNGMSWYNTEPELGQLFLSVNMEYYMSNNMFRPWEGDYVDVAGQFNGWGEFPIQMMHAFNQTYTATISNVVVGESYEFKFRINNPGWGGPWWENDPNRSVTMDEGYVEYSAWFNNEEPIISANVNPNVFTKLINWEYENPAEAIITWNSASQIVDIFAWDYEYGEWYNLSTDVWDVVDIDGLTATLFIDLEQFNVPYKSKPNKDDVHNYEWTDIRIVFDMGEEINGGIIEAYKTFSLGFTFEDELGNPIENVIISVAPVDSDGRVFDIENYNIEVAARADYSYIATAEGFKATIGNVIFVEEDRNIEIVLEALTGDEVSATIDTEELRLYFNWDTPDSEIIITWNDAVSVINFSYYDTYSGQFNSLLPFYGPKAEGGLWEITDDNGVTASLWIYWENAPSKNGNKEADYFLDESQLKIDFLIGDPALIDFKIAIKAFTVEFDIRDNEGVVIPNANIDIDPSDIVFAQNGYAFDIAATSNVDYFITASGYSRASGSILNLVADEVVNIVLEPFVSATMDPSDIIVYDNWDNEQYQSFVITWNDADEIIEIQYDEENSGSWQTFPSSMWEIVDIDGLTANLIIDIYNKSNFASKDSQQLIDSGTWRVIFNDGLPAYGLVNFFYKTFNISFIVENTEGQVIPNASIELTPNYDGSPGTIFGQNVQVFEVSARKDYNYSVFAPGYYGSNSQIFNVEEDLTVTVSLEPTGEPIPPFITPDVIEKYVNWDYENPANITVYWNSASEILSLELYDWELDNWTEMSTDAWELVDIDGFTASLLIDLDHSDIPFKFGPNKDKDGVQWEEWQGFRINFDLGYQVYGGIVLAYKTFEIAFNVEDELGNPIANANVAIAPIDANGKVFNNENLIAEVAANAEYTYLVTASGFQASIGSTTLVEDDQFIDVVLEALTGDEISATIDTESLTYFYNWPTEDSEIIITYNDAVSVINFSFSDDGEEYESLLSMYGPKDEGGLWEILNDNGETASLWIYWENAPNKNYAGKEQDYILEHAFLRIDFLIGEPADIDFLFAAKTFEVAFDIKDELGEPIENVSIELAPDWFIFNQDEFVFDLAATFDFEYLISASGFKSVFGEIINLMEDMVIEVVMQPFISATIDPTFLNVYDNWDNPQFVDFTITWNDAENVEYLEAFIDGQWFMMPSEMYEVVDIDGLTASFIIDLSQSPGKSNTKENDYIVETIDWRVVFNEGEPAYGVTNMVVKTFNLEFVVKNNNDEIISGAIVELMPWFGDDNAGDIWDEENNPLFEVSARGDYEYIITAPGYISVQSTILYVEEDLVVEIFMDIEEFAIIGVGSSDPIVVDFGTQLEDVNLPETVFVLLENSSWNFLEVTWDGGTPEYNALAAGTYEFEGTLTLIEGIINPYDAKAYITVIVNPEKEIVAVASFTPIQVFIGTAIEDVNFPTSVQVTLDDSSVRSLEVIWDGGTPTYDGGATGTYVFEGAIQLVTGIINSASHTATINVIVFDTEKVIASVEEVDDITVFYGTELADVGLPAHLLATTEDSYEVSLSVNWDSGTPEFNSEVPDTYVFTGTLALIPGFTNPNDIVATVNVIVVLKEVVAVAELPDVIVPYGTALEDLNLPVIVEVTLSDNSTAGLEINWDGGTPIYNGTTVGEYVFEGALTLIEGVANTSNLKAELTVYVVNKEVVAVAELEDITVEFGTELGEIALPTTVEVTLEDDSVVELSLEWNPGTPAYNGNVAGTYPLIGTLQLIDGVANTAGYTASVNVIVEEEVVDLEVVSVASIADITVDYGTAFGDLNLPPTVEVTLDDDSVIDLAVAWSSGSPAYNGNVAGTYPIVGTLILIEGVANTAGITAAVNVIVEEEQEIVIISTFPYIQPFEDEQAPYGWTVEDNATKSFVWEFNGIFAFADSDAAGNGAYVHTTLYTPIFDVSSLNNPRFSFDHYFRIYDGSLGIVKYTTDGETWNTIVEYEETTGSGTFNAPNYASAVIAIGELIGDATQFQIAFEYNDLGNWEWYWIVDNFVVEETPVVNSYTVTFSVEGENGSIAASVDGTPIDSGDEVEQGKNIVFTATPDTDYIVKAWYLNGSVVSGETGTTYTYNNITADIEVKVEFEYSNVITDIITVDVRVYPNPAKTNALIKSDSRIKEIVVVGMLGDVIFEQAVGDMSYNLNVSGFNPGIYFIRVVTENGIVTKRLMVN